MKDIRIICNVLEIKKKKYPDFQAMTLLLLFYIHYIMAHSCSKRRKFQSWSLNMNHQNKILGI